MASVREYKTERRISKIISRLGATDDQHRKVLYAFERLVVLKKEDSDILSKTHARTFHLGAEEYHQKMLWINEFMRSIGFEEDIFTDIYSYETSSKDYDYYYAFKTPSQYKAEQLARESKVDK